MEHRLYRLHSLRGSATEPAKPQGTLSAPLASIFLLVLGRARHRSSALTPSRNWLSTKNAKGFHCSFSLTGSTTLLAQHDGFDF